MKMTVTRWNYLCSNRMQQFVFLLKDITLYLDKFKVIWHALCTTPVVNEIRVFLKSKVVIGTSYRLV